MSQRHRESETSRQYALLKTNPKLQVKNDSKNMLSAFSIHICSHNHWHVYHTITCLCVASRTFSTFPRNGKTPYRSRPTTPSPAVARVLAESPSVRIRVQCIEFFVPASLASSNFGIPRSLERFAAEHFWFSCVCCLKRIQICIASTMPLLLA